MVPTLHTARLELRPLAIEDAPQIQSIFPQWEIVRHLAATIPWPYPDDGALVFCRDHAPPAMAREDAWHWTIRLRQAPSQIIGMASLMRGDNHNRGFWLAPAWWGQGLMTEAIQPVTDFWFDVLGCPVLRVPKAVANTASRKISVRSGMRLIATEERDSVSGRQPFDIWEITADEWRSRVR